MPRYITLPIEVSPETLAQDSYEFLQSKFPNWRPAEGNLDTWMLQATASEAADLMRLVSQVPAAIFRYFGASLVNVQPVDATFARVDTTWTVVDNAGYTIAAGTEVGIRSAGDTLIPFVVVQDVVIPPGSTVTAAGEVPLEALIAGADGSGLGAPASAAELITPLSYVVSVTQTDITTGGVDAETDDAYLDRLRAELQLLSPRPILPGDFSTLAREHPSVWRATTIDLFNPDFNQLSLNAASVESSIADWVADVNATIASSTTEAADGIRSVRMVATANGDMTSRLVTPKTAVAGQQWTAMASIKSSVARTAHVELQFLDAADALLQTIVGATAPTLTTAFTQFLAQGVAPSNTAKVRMRVYITGAVTTDFHYHDKMALTRGSESVWTAGGGTGFDQERMVSVALQDSTGAASSAQVKAEVQAMLDAQREVNFVVNIIDPLFKAIAVTYTFQPMPGRQAADVMAAIDAALTDYLDPKKWGLPEDGDPRVWVNQDTVRYLEIATLINNTPGVDYIGTLFIGPQGGSLTATDYVMTGGPAMLPTPGTFTGAII